MLIYIENKELLTKIITYLDYNNKKYTLDINTNYEYIVISDINKKSIELSRNKKVIFLTNLLEEKIHRVFTKNNKQNREYKRLLINNLNNFYKIITTLDSIKDILKKQIETEIITINKELNISNYKDIYTIKKRKNILFIDFDYEGLNNVYNLSQKYDNIIYLGFKPYYNMTKREKIIYNKLPNNIIKIKYYNLDIFESLLKITDLVISETNLMLYNDYLYKIILLKKQLLMKENILNNYIDNKEIYKYEDLKTLLIKTNKILTNRLSNITDNIYEEIISNTFTQISKKYSDYLT